MGSISGLKLVEVTANFLRSEAFTKPVHAFVERECLVFEAPAVTQYAPLDATSPLDNGEGFEHALADVQAAYGKVVSDLIEKSLSSVGASWDKLQAACLNNPRAASTRAVRNALEACSDFPSFFDMMAECNLALEAKALELWHMQTQFGFDDEDLAAEAEGSDALAPLPSSETLRQEYGISEATVRELEAARAELGGGEGLVAKLSSLVHALDDDEVDPIQAALNGVGAGDSPQPPTGGTLSITPPDAAVSLRAAGTVMSAPPTVSTEEVSPRPEAPAIHVTATDTLTSAPPKGFRQAAFGAQGAGLPLRTSLQVQGPPSPTSQGDVVPEGAATGVKQKHVPALAAAGPLSAPAKQSVRARPLLPARCCPFEPPCTCCVRVSACWLSCGCCVCVWRGMLCTGGPGRRAASGRGAIAQWNGSVQGASQRVLVEGCDCPDCTHL
jgi:hypothetical protein